MRSILFLLAATCGLAAPAVKVSVIADRGAGPAVQHGLKKLKVALQEKKLAYEEVAELKRARGEIRIIAGLGAGVPESLAIQHTVRNGKQALVVSGGDDRGLMYALLEVAARIGWAADPGNPLSEVRDVREKPAVLERAVSMYTMSRSHFESYFYNQDYWARYFDLLARNRFNSFALLFAYEAAGYFAPAYPYFFDVEGFPEVRVVGLTAEQQRRNLGTLKQIIRMAHERGLNFTVGLWDHIYRGGVQGPAQLAEKPTPGLVWGLNEKNLTAYIKGALEKFLRVVPEVDALQFRMHGESGLKRAEMKEFWEALYQVMKQSGGQRRFTFRIKEFPDDLIERALELGLNFRLATKYWAEQMGLPFHPTHINRQNQFDRRHSYADVLRYPQRYKMHWRLWNGGTARVLLWGDPEYARRFAESTHLYDGEGFEVNEPLATKMAGHPHDMPPFQLLRPEYRYYDYEFERYWHFFQVFGRVGYNPDTPAEVWEREFQRRFGREAGPLVERGLHRASQVLPRIIAYCFPYHRFPTTRGWVEKQRLEDLPVYARAEPSDLQQFQSFEEAARGLLEGKDSAKISPEETSRWFARTSADILALVDEAEKRVGAQRNKEFDSTMVDLRILGNLALYHARRIPAGLSLALFHGTQDLNALEDAIAHEQRAIQAWEGIVQAAGEVYNDDLKMGLPSAELSGHWKDELVKLRQGLAELERQRAGFKPEPRRVVGRYDFGNGPALAGYQRLKRQSVVSLDLPNGSYELDFTIQDPSADWGPMWIAANGIDYTDVFRAPAGTRVEKKLAASVTDGKLNVVFDAPSDGRWQVSAMTVTRVDPLIAHAPVRRIAPGEDLVIRATVSAEKPAARVRVGYGEARRGYSYASMEQSGPLRYRAVIPGGEGLEYFIEALDEAGRQAQHGPVSVMVTSDREPPVVRHTAVASAPARQPLKIVAQVQDPSGVKWVRLRYRSVNQHQDFRTLTMLPAGRNNEYQAEVPAAHLDPKYDFMYLIEVMDNAGNGKIHPDLEKETPYLVVRLRS